MVRNWDWKVQHVRHDQKGMPNSWGRWKCGKCGNVQTGSECKGCKQKWWHLPGTRCQDASKSGTPGPKTSAWWNTPWSYKAPGQWPQGKPEKAAPKDPPGNSFREQLEALEKAHQGKPEGAGVASAAHLLAEKLKTTEPRRDKTKRLQSVMDQLKDR